MKLEGRVVAGIYRKKPLKLLFTSKTRSTKDRVKEAMFSSLGDIKGLTCLDLFAGSGALGIEAISRGAGKVIFNDQSGEATLVIHENLKGINEKFAVYQKDYHVLLTELSEESIDLLFLDPPYELDINIVLKDVFNAKILKKNFIITIETDKEFTMVHNNATIRNYKYGLTKLAIIRGINV